MLEAECFLVSESFTLDSGCLFSFKHFIVFTQHVLFVTISLFSTFFNIRKHKKSAKNLLCQISQIQILTTEEDFC